MVIERPGSTVSSRTRHEELASAVDAAIDDPLVDVAPGWAYARAADRLEISCWF